jgi:hypothetical protein
VQRDDAFTELGRATARIQRMQRTMGTVMEQVPSSCHPKCLPLLHVWLLQGSTLHCSIWVSRPSSL